MNGFIDAAIAGRAGGGPVELTIALFVLAVLPLIAVTMTSFTRIIVVLGLLRTSIGAPSLPPNIVLVALAVALSSIVMAPTLQRVETAAVAPLGAHRIGPAEAIARGAEPLCAFMRKQVRPADLRAFSAMAGDAGARPAGPAFSALIAAFLVDELRSAFAMGFALALPFAVIDIVVAGVLMSLGMFMVSPAAISLPLKLLLFVTADGWSIVAGALVQSFR